MTFKSLELAATIGLLFLGSVHGSPITVAPSATTTSAIKTCDQSLCVDYINECSMMYGGYFLDPKCTGGTAWPTFTKPPCPTTTTKEPASPTQTCTQRICADYVNECGQWYGGCFLDPVCTGGTKWPSFTKPTCPPTTTAALKPRTTTSCDSTICADFVNECGLKYGGCFLDPKCTGGTAWPTFSKPPCPTTSRTTSTRKPVKTCSQSICADYVNECGRKYGGRFLGPKCTSGTAWPKFPKPPCPTTITTTECSTICAEYINECGQQFGQCL